MSLASPKSATLTHKYSSTLQKYYAANPWFCLVATNSQYAVGEFFVAVAVLKCLHAIPSGQVTVNKSFAS